eukprot:gb/GECG01003170.1/.p1 GENE.gb/GECG01003170.1/~~gb/GECG01003170.1/.p1  ORF type:complete len:173 (+),score=24.27 gb/GECG01003170.1/:1-519(+)
MSSDQAVSVSGIAEAAAKAASENADNKARGSPFVNRLEVTDPNVFDQFRETAANILNAEKGSKGAEDRIFCLFTGAKDPSTGQSWCPDCDKAKPVIEEALRKINHPIVLLECQVNRDEYKNNPEYPYRTHRTIKLESLPTLIRLGSSRATAKLGESECADQDLVEEVFGVED